MNKLLKTAKESQLELVTTEKDHFRLKKMGYTDISHIDVKLKIEKEEELIEELKKYL